MPSVAAEALDVQDERYVEMLQDVPQGIGVLTGRVSQQQLATFHIHIQFQTIGAMGNGLLAGRQGIFAGSDAVPAMADDMEWRSAHSSRASCGDTAG